MGLTIWLIITVILIVVEIITLGLTSIWFAGGAFVAGLISLTGVHWLVQLLVFAVVSTLLFVFTRPFAAKHLMKNVEKTNVDSLIGQTGLVTQDIDNLNAKGQVKVRGQIWTARSISDEVKLHEGQKVSIESISGVKVIVKPM